MSARYFATARDWVATSSRGSFATALEYARQRAKLYGRAEVWTFDEPPGTFTTPGPARLTMTVYAAPSNHQGARAVRSPAGRACGCPPGEHVPACRAWGAL